MPEDEKPVDDVAEESNVVETEPPENTEEPTENSDEQATEDSEESYDENDEDEEPAGPNILQRGWAKYKAKKKITVPATVALLLIVLFGVPASRYGILGIALKKDVPIRIIDSQTNVPVSGVDVSLRGKTAKTDGEGKALLRGVRVGSGEITVTKKYYKDTSATVLTGLKPKQLELKLEATGRQVPVHIINKISGENIAGVTIRAADTEAETDQNGETTLVLPASQQKMQAKLSKDGFNELSVEVTVNNATVKNNTFGMVLSGKIYFLSKKTGTIDVVKTDLDGSNRQTVLAGTGTEEDGDTVLLASRDWRYLALKSRRDNTRAALYLIDTKDDTLTEIDSGSATFTLVGWSGHYFAYTVERHNVPIWQPKGHALKTYNADAKQLQTIDETRADGSSDNDYAREFLGTVYILKDTLVYTKSWNAHYYSMHRLAGKHMGIHSVKASGENKQTLKQFDAGNNAYFNAILSEPHEIYYGMYNNGSEAFYEYSDNKLSETNKFGNEALNRFYPTYLVSPGGNATFWYEPRDGKNTLFTGNSDGKSGKEIASLSEFVPYGWFTDDYLLMSKNNSELYIQPTRVLSALSQVLKISDYHKPDYSFYGYGYGYGGL